MTKEFAAGLKSILVEYLKDKQGEVNVEDIMKEFGKDWQDLAMRKIFVQILKNEGIDGWTYKSGRHTAKSRVIKEGFVSSPSLPSRKTETRFPQTLESTSDTFDLGASIKAPKEPESWMDLSSLTTEASKLEEIPARLSKLREDLRSIEVSSSEVLKVVHYSLRTLLRLETTVRGAIRATESELKRKEAKKEVTNA